MKQLVVLDKSYLESKPRATVHEACAKYRLVMHATLFFELVTSSDQHFRRACFRKFPNEPESVILLDHPTALMRFEARRLQPATPIDKLRVDLSLPSLFELGSGTIDWRADQLLTLRRWRNDIAEDAVLMTAGSAAIHEWFPELSSYTPGQPIEPITAAIARVTTDYDFIRFVYRQIRRSDFPAAVTIDEQWAFFRWVQVELLQSLELVRRYGHSQFDVRAREIAQDAADSHYLITSSLADGLATCDKHLQRMFSLLRPTGALLT